ncbi:MAG: PD40 domain-containing protein [Acidimicrobiales bacterium]|nr:PD40 domain-containing protein [Acidimicrobiales bacterium]
MAEPEATEPHPRRARRLALVAAAALVATGVVAATVLSRSGTEEDARPALEGCGPGVDRLALEASTGERDDRLFDGFTSIGVQRTDEAEIDWLNDPMQVITQPSSSPTGRQVAVRWADGDYESAGPNSESIWVVDVADGNARPLTLGTSDHSPDWSPDGATIAFVRQGAEGRAVVMSVPAEGGPPTELLELEGDAWSGGLTWTPDGDLLAWEWQRASDRTTVHRIDVDGTSEELATIDGTARTGAVADGALLLRVWPDRSSGDTVRRAVDLGDGTVRDVAGPVGDLAASADGERLYLLGDDGAGVHRATFDGTTVAEGDPVATDVAHATGIAVGTCAADPAAEPRPDHPLLGTDWRLSYRRLAVLPRPPVEGCEEPACTPIRIAVTEDYLDPEGPAAPCVVATGTLRGEAVRTDDVAIGGGAGCEQLVGWAEQPPVGLRVEGDLLHLELAGPRTVEPYVVTYGAWYVGDEPEVRPSELPSDDELDAIVATTTTTAPPPPADCAVVDRFARDLEAASVELASPDASTPAALAEASTVVVRGLLVDGDLVSEVGGPADGAVAYDLLVTEVLAGDAPDVAVGETVAVLVPFRFDDDPVPPALGALGASVVGRPDPLGSIDAVAFLTDEGATWPGDLLVHGRRGLAVACDGEAPAGLVGTEGAWAAPDLDELAARVRGG